MIVDANVVTAPARRFSDLALAAVLIAAGAELLRVEPADRGRVAFVLAPSDRLPDLFTAEVEHHAGRLRVASRDVLTTLHGLRSLLRAARIDSVRLEGAS